METLKKIKAKSNPPPFLGKTLSNNLIPNSISNNRISHNNGNLLPNINNSHTLNKSNSPTKNNNHTINKYSSLTSKHNSNISRKLISNSHNNNLSLNSIDCPPRSFNNYKPSSSSNSVNRREHNIVQKGEGGRQGNQGWGAGKFFSGSDSGS